VEEFPFRTVIPDSEAGLDVKIAVEKARGKVTEAWVGHIYENAWQIRGYEEFLADMVLCPRVSDAILERIAARNKDCAVAMARSGVDMIRTGDDVAGQQGMIFGADRWRKVLKPLWKDVYAAAKAANPDLVIWYHSDGNIMEIIEDLIEIGVDILNPVQPECMDLTFLRKEYGSRLVFDGSIGTQSVMPFGTPEQVRDTVRRMKDLLGADGGLILSPTHVLEPEVPVKNVLAFVEACRES
jgi:uroporphyrinogen decarboxylase